MTQTIIAITLILIFLIGCVIISAIASLDEKLEVLSKLELRRADRDGLLTLTEQQQLKELGKEQK